ncbi:uncharacterized protein MCYG_08274 [Microsporum canis CBS 113480]|uniref:Uncharacterized protein n=1 Tax=Arthroderma otae (strain ATCC MYA-4605 / CBS 113480) TaxID=554155 RepID=C5G002_ARTOC|nr:uncharacterized protein MCYG_08274 [Microsporum canis CBS 113480]EEQ35455.1 predicted protein [Microsporum canis CBS 113480]
MVSGPFQLPPDRPIPGGLEQPSLSRRISCCHEHDGRESTTVEVSSHASGTPAGREVVRITTRYTPPPPWKPRSSRRRRRREKGEKRRGEAEEGEALRRPVWSVLRAFLAKLLAF